MMYISPVETFVWEKAVTTGTPPSPRDSHTCSSWKNNIIVIGGEDGHDYCLSDVHILDIGLKYFIELTSSLFHSPSFLFQLNFSINSFINSILMGSLFLFF